tara:strand:- start:331 stop:642 length:312 start_codon:yes stop_codon:yes gene_type:complete
MSFLLVNIKELISFYVRINYEEYLKENKLEKIEEDKIRGIVENMFNTRQEHLKNFVKEALKDILKEETPPNENIEQIFAELFEDKNLCIIKITNEIKIYQKNK